MPPIPPKPPKPFRKALSRRQFLEGSAAGLAVLGVGCGSDAEKDDGPSGIVPVPEGMAAVSIIGGKSSVLEQVRRAIDLAGGIEAIEPGQTVFIKPNVVHGSVAGAPAIITSLDVLQAVIQLVKERDPGYVVVGDRSARFVATHDYAFVKSGLADAALEAGADEVYMARPPADAPDEWTLVQPAAYDESWAAEGGILAMKRILEADHLINLPVCKNHRWAAYSLSMKNFIGGVGDDSRDVMHFNEGDPDRLGRDIAILNQIFSPLINVLDARVALLNGGPEGILGDEVRSEPGLMLASTDRVALDAAGITLIKHELKGVTVPSPDALHDYTVATAPWQFPQVVHGIERGLGVDSPDKVELRPENAPLAAELQAAYIR